MTLQRLFGAKNDSAPEMPAVKEPYTLREIGHVKDLLVYISTYAPNKFSNEASQYMNSMDAAFATLERSIDALEPQTGSQCTTWLRDRAAAAREQYDLGNRREGFGILREMKAKAWSKRKWS